MKLSGPNPLLPSRKIIQIAIAQISENSETECDGAIFALCDDGELFFMDKSRFGTWTVVPGVPQPKESK